MKTYNYKLQGWQRLVGVITGDDDIGIGFSRGDVSRGDTHEHPDRAEYYICISGSGTLWIAPTKGDPKIYRLKPGIIRKVEKGEPHRLLSVFKDSDEEPYEVFSIQTPGGIDKIDVEDSPELKRLMQKHGLYPKN